MGPTFIWVLVAVHTIAPFHRPHDTQLMREHVAVYSTEDRCQLDRRATQGFVHDEMYFCQKEMLK